MESEGLRNIYIENHVQPYEQKGLISKENLRNFYNYDYFTEKKSQTLNLMFSILKFSLN
jgi:hypothetical protein